MTSKNTLSALEALRDLSVAPGAVFIASGALTLEEIEKYFKKK